MIIAGLQKVTLIDYPGKISCVVFTHGCNFRCPFCHNPELVVEKADRKNGISENDFVKFLEKRKNKLDGVVITGGEPLLNLDLENFIVRIKDMGFCIKLDTNGSNPTFLKKLLDKSLLDYVAMDIKIGIEDYENLTTWKDNGKVLESIKIIQKHAPNYEFRTTVVRDIHNEDNLKEILNLITGSKKFAIQNFRAGHSISKDLGKRNEFKRDELERFSQIFKKNIKEVIIRNNY